MVEADKKRKYRCKKHMSNEGYYDSNNQWQCWECYFEDIYNNPRGTIVKYSRIRKYTLRVVDRSERHIVVEVFKERMLVDKFTYRDLSLALRKYEELTELIETGRYRKRTRRQSFSQYIDRNEAEEEEIEIQYPTQVTIGSSPVS